MHRVRHLTQSEVQRLPEAAQIDVCVLAEQPLGSDIPRDLLLHYCQTYVAQDDETTLAAIPSSRALAPDSLCYPAGRMTNVFHFVALGLRSRAPLLIRNLIRYRSGNRILDLECLHLYLPKRPEDWEAVNARYPFSPPLHLVEDAALQACWWFPVQNGGGLRPVRVALIEQDSEDARVIEETIEVPEGLAARLPLLSSLAGAMPLILPQPAVNGRPAGGIVLPPGVA